jgi:sodium/potassium-transporting ATPase subunit alpha
MEWQISFAILLWAGAVLCFIAYGVYPADPSNLYLGIVLIAVIFIGTTVEFLQNRKSQAIM